MAIASNRIKTKSAVDLVDRNYLSAIDKTKDVAPNTLDKFKSIAVTSKAINAIGKKNIFSKDALPEIDKALQAMGMYPKTGEKACCDGSSTNGVHTKHLSDRSLSLPHVDPQCPVTPGCTLTAKSVLNDLTTGLPESMVSALETMTLSQISNLNKGVTLPAIQDKNGMMQKAMKAAQKSLSASGMTTKSKADMMSLLKCMNGSGYNGDENTALNNLLAANILQSSLCKSPKKMLTMVQDMAKQGTLPTGDIMKATVKSLVASAKADPNIKAKIMANIHTQLGTVIPNEQAKTVGSETAFVNSLNGTCTTRSPVTERNNAIAALDNISPGWNISGTGQVCGTVAKGNTYLKDISTKSLRSSYTAPSAMAAPTVPTNPTNPDYMAKLMLAANTSKTNITNGSMVSLRAYQR